MSNTSLIEKQDLPTELVEALHGNDDMLRKKAAEPVSGQHI